MKKRRIIIWFCSTSGSGKGKGHLESEDRIQGKEDTRDQDGSRNMNERDYLELTECKVHFVQH